MRQVPTIVLPVLAIATLLLMLCPLHAHSADDQHSNSNSSSAQRIFKHVSPEAKSVASLTLAIITVLIALLALIGNRRKAQTFYDVFPCPVRLNLSTWVGQATHKVLQLFSTKNCILSVLLLSTVFTIVCFFAHLVLEQGRILVIVDQFVEFAMFIAIGLFMNVLARAFGFYLSLGKNNSSGGPQTEGGSVQ